MTSKHCLSSRSDTAAGNVVLATTEVNARGYRYPVLLEGCTGCKVCAQVCPDFCFQVYRFDEPQERPT